jgi:hypothetical protein
MCQNAVELTPDGHLDKIRYTGDLVYSLQARFEKLGDVADLAQSISLYSDVVRRTPNRHPDKPGCMLNFSISLFGRFHRSEDIADLEQACSFSIEADNVMPIDHPLKFKLRTTWFIF